MFSLATESAVARKSFLPNKDLLEILDRRQLQYWPSIAPLRERLRTALPNFDGSRPRQVSLRPTSLWSAEAARKAVDAQEESRSYAGIHGAYLLIRQLSSLTRYIPGE